MLDNFDSECKARTLLSQLESYLSTDPTPLKSELKLALDLLKLYQELSLLESTASSSTPLDYFGHLFSEL